jgi:hypothetical protein
MTDQPESKASPTPLHRGPAHASPYPMQRLAPAVQLVDLAAQIAEADQQVASRVSAQLQVIADQVKALQAQARRILEQARQDQQLNHARCAFKRIPGRLYHLYRRPDQGLEFSLLSPADWGGQPPQPYVGSYRLEPDYSWTPLEELDRADDSRETVSRLLGRPPEI